MSWISWQKSTSDRCYVAMARRGVMEWGGEYPMETRHYRPSHQPIHKRKARTCVKADTGKKQNSWKVACAVQ